MTLAFITTRLNPTDPILAIVGDKQMQNPQVVDAARERWGLDGSLLEQYLAYLDAWAEWVMNDLPRYAPVSTL